MHTIIMDMKDGPDETLICQAGEIIRSGGLVAFPTETVYGLGGDGLNALSSRKIYEAKGRPSDNPLIVHIADFEALYPIVKEVTPMAKRLGEHFWPGPLTMILPKSDLVPEQTTGGLDTVAVRMPSHPIAAALIRAGGGYIAAPSANLSGRPSPTRASHVIEDMTGRIDAIIDGGDADIGLESTIVDLSCGEPVVLRPGYIGLPGLREVIGDVMLDPGLLREEDGVRPKAPGMKYRHYAPRAPLTIVDGTEENVTEWINAKVLELSGRGEKAGIICTEESKGAYRQGIIRCVGTRSDEATIARHLYDVLREFDALGVSQIWSEAFDTPKMGTAIMNRLIKAAGHHVVHV